MYILEDSNQVPIISNKSDNQLKCNHMGPIECLSLDSGKVKVVICLKAAHAVLFCLKGPAARAHPKKEETDDTPEARTYLLKKAGYKRDGDTDDTPEARTYLMKKIAYKRDEVVGRGLFDPLKRAASAAGCDCETAYQQCRKQNGCNNYYRFLTERMIKRIWAGGFNPGAGSSNPCATCVSISIMTFKSLIF